MEEHSTWIAETVNRMLGPLIAPARHALLTTLYGWFGKPYVPGEHVIPEHVIFAIIVFLGCCIFFPLVRLTFSVEKPGKLQQILELFVESLGSQMEDIIGHGGKRYLPMVATIGLFILLMNLSGQIPGFKPPTSNINVTAGCALCVFVYYNYLGMKKKGVFGCLKQFAGPVVFLAPLMIPIEIISHLARPFSLTIRLFANIFSEHLIVGVFFGLIPFLVPLPIMVLGLFTTLLQAFIFMVLPMVYIQGAVAEEH